MYATPLFRMTFARRSHIRARTREIRGRRASMPSLAAGIGALLLLPHSGSFAHTAELNLITPIATVRVDQTDRFVARDVFKTGQRIGGRTLSSVGWSFAEHFLNVVENDVPAATLKVWGLQYTMGDAALIRKLGGEARATVSSIAHVYRLMEASDVASHTDGRSNIAYVRSPVDQRLWAVHWTTNYSSEWTIGAVYVPHEHLDWHADTRLIVNDRANDRLNAVRITR